MFWHRNQKASLVVSFWRATVFISSLECRSLLMESWNYHSGWKPSGKKSRAHLSLILKKKQFKHKTPGNTAKLIFSAGYLPVTHFSSGDAKFTFYVNKSVCVERKSLPLSVNFWLLTSVTGTGRFLLSKLKNRVIWISEREKCNMLLPWNLTHLPSIAPRKR